MFERLRADLEGAIAQERALAPAARQSAQQAQLERTTEAYWSGVDRLFARARAGDDAEAIRLIRSTLIGQQRAIDGMVAQFLVTNNRMQEEAAQANRSIYDRVAAEILVLVGVLLIAIAAAGAWIVMANRRAFEAVREVTAQLRTLSRHTLQLQEDLQRSVSRELHDDFSQILTAIGTLLGRARRHLPGGSPLAVELDEVRRVAQETLDRIRTESQWLHPGALEDFGLEKTLARLVEQFGRQSGIPTTLETSGPIDRVRPEFAIHVYRIVQEALNNIAKHAEATSARVEVRHAGGQVVVEVTDDGVGGAHTERGSGLRGLADRVEAIEGRLRIWSPPGGGTRLRAELPCE
jgi:signal transduction histidine kinase